MTKETGGPAFPISGQFSTRDGMTLRDWFAGQALMMIITDGYVDFQNAGWQKRISSSAFEIADAMIAERDKP